jgi:hypothetical protein
MSRRQGGQPIFDIPKGIGRERRRRKREEEEEEEEEEEKTHPG